MRYITVHNIAQLRALQTHCILCMIISRLYAYKYIIECMHVLRDIDLNQQVFGYIVLLILIKLIT